MTEAKAAEIEKLTGRQILENCRTKARIISRRNVAAYLRGETESTGTPGMDIFDDEIAKAFDRIRALSHKGSSNG